MRRSDFTALYVQSPAVYPELHKHVVMNQDMIGIFNLGLQVLYYPTKGAKISHVRPTLLDDTVFFVEKDIESQIEYICSNTHNGRLYKMQESDVLAIQVCSDSASIADSDLHGGNHVNWNGYRQNPK